MRAEALRTVEVREVAAALDSRETVQLVQHHVNRETCLRYLLLTDQQYWRLMEFIRLDVAHSDRAGQTADGKNQMRRK